MDLAFLHHVRDVAVVALREEHRARGQHDPLRLLVHRPPARRELDHVIGEREEPVVVRGDDHRAARARALAQQPEHALHLELVEVRGRLVGEQQRRIEAQRARDRDALLLPAGEVGRTVPQPFGEPERLEHRPRPPGPARSRPRSTPRPRRCRARSGSG